MLRTLELPRDALAPALARHAVGVLVADLDPRLVDDARLLVSELVTNSVRYGAGPVVRVRIRLDAGRGLRCEVTDDGVGFVPTTGAVEGGAGGWGLRLVDRLADGWGVADGSTHVWFELSVAAERAPGARPAMRAG